VTHLGNGAKMWENLMDLGRELFRRTWSLTGGNNQYAMCVSWGI